MRRALALTDSGADLSPDQVAEQLLADENDQPLSGAAADQLRADDVDPDRPPSPGDDPRRIATWHLWDHDDPGDPDNALGRLNNPWGQALDDPYAWE